MTAQLPKNDPNSPIARDDHHESKCEETTAWLGRTIKKIAKLCGESTLDGACGTASCVDIPLQLIESVAITIEQGLARLETPNVNDSRLIRFYRDTGSLSQLIRKVRDNSVRLPFRLRSYINNRMYGCDITPSFDAVNVYKDILNLYLFSRVNALPKTFTVVPEDNGEKPISPIEWSWFRKQLKEGNFLRITFQDKTCDALFIFSKCFVSISEGGMFPIPENINDLEEDKLPLMRQFIRETVERVVSYKLEHPNDNTVHFRVELPLSSIQNRPLSHISQLLQLYGQSGRLPQEGLRHEGLSISLLDNDLSRMVGVDAGGIQREYFTALWMELARKYFDENGMPSQGKWLVYDDEYKGDEVTSAICGFQPVDYEKPSAYYYIGIFMIHNYLSGVVTGKHFDPDFFKVVFTIGESLELDQMNDVFFILAERGIRESGPEKCYHNFYQLFLDVYRDEKRANGAELLDALKNLGVDLGDVPETYEGNEEAVEKLCSQFMAEKFSGIIGPAITIASIIRGALEEKWVDFFHTHKAAYIDFSDKLQGKLDAESIIQQTVNRGSSDETYEWVKDWIMDHAHDQKALENFLRFVTAAPTLSPNHSITIKPNRCEAVHNRQSFFAHTCSFEIDVPQNLDKASFFRGLNHAIGGEISYNHV